jgi:hypothetical protein
MREAKGKTAQLKRKKDINDGASQLLKVWPRLGKKAEKAASGSRQGWNSRPDCRGGRPRPALRWIWK